MESIRLANALLATINNCIDLESASTQNRSSVSRPLRIVMENGWHHIMNRGIDGRWLFGCFRTSRQTSKRAFPVAARQDADTLWSLVFPILPRLVSSHTRSSRISSGRLLQALVRR